MPGPGKRLLPFPPKIPLLSEGMLISIFWEEMKQKTCFALIFLINKYKNILIVS